MKSAGGDDNAPAIHPANSEPGTSHAPDLDAVGESGLSIKQERAIAALLQEATVGKAAAAAGVGERTIYRWLDMPRFADAYRKARREAFGQAIAQTQRYAPLAVHTLVTLMSDRSTPANVRANAAATLLKFGREGIELDDLAARIDVLEKVSSVQAWQSPLAARH